MNVIDLDHLPPSIRERWPIAVKRAEEKTQRLQSNAPAATRLVHAAQRARSVAQRVVWLQRAASAWAQPFDGVAACRRGCSHCCHIPVVISATEASLIGTAIGRAPEHPARTIQLSRMRSPEEYRDAESRMLSGRQFGEACPFLAVDHTCSIYAHRPLACRTLLNLDDDELLCRLVPQIEVPVPYADANQLKAFYLAAQPNAELADIRDFFPQRGTTR